VVAILAAGDPIPASLLDAAGTSLNAWAAYPVAWSSSGTQPVLNNGTLLGYYILSGKTYDIRIRLVAGSTTTFGTGTWFFSVPTARLSTENLDGAFSGLAYGGSANRYLVTSQEATSTTFSLMASGTPTSGVSAAVPFTWASTHTLSVRGTYEAP
jgi:hypothetical protein